MILVYVQLGGTLISLVLFSVGAIVGKGIVKSDAEAKRQTEEEEKEPMNHKEWKKHNQKLAWR